MPALAQQPVQFSDQLANRRIAVFGQITRRGSVSIPTVGGRFVVAATCNIVETLARISADESVLVPDAQPYNWREVVELMRASRPNVHRDEPEIDLGLEF